MNQQRTIGNLLYCCYMFRHYCITLLDTHTQAQYIPGRHNNSTNIQIVYYYNYYNYNYYYYYIIIIIITTNCNWVVTRWQQSLH